MNYNWRMSAGGATAHSPGREPWVKKSQDPIWRDF